MRKGAKYQCISCKLLLSLLIQVPFVLFYSHLALAAVSIRCLTEHLAENLNGLLTQEDVIIPIESGRVGQSGNFKQEETGILLSAKNPHLKKILEEATKAGGEIRILSNVDVRTGQIVVGTSYASYDPVKHLPYIAIDPQYPWEGVVHELTHLYDMLDLKKNLMGSGITGEELEIEMMRFWDDPVRKHTAEKRAISRQFQASAALTKAKGRLPRDAMSPKTPTIAMSRYKENIDYFITHSVYPEMEAILLLLKKIKIQPTDKVDASQVIPYVDEAISNRVPWYSLKVYF